jgi:hypothetical protein
MPHILFILQTHLWEQDINFVGQYPYQINYLSLYVTLNVLLEIIGSSEIQILFIALHYSDLEAIMLITYRVATIHQTIFSTSDTFIKAFPLCD